MSNNEKDISTNQPKYGSWSYPDIRLELSEEDYYKIRSLEEKIEGINRVRVRYDKTKTKRYRMLEKQK